MVCLHGHRGCSVIYFLDKCEASCVAVAVSTGGCVVCWLWTVSLQLFYLGDFFFLNHGGGILRMLPRMIYTVYIHLSEHSMSLQTAQRTQTDTGSRYTQTSTRIQFTDMHADTCTHTSFDKFRPKPGGFSLPCRVIYTEGVWIETDNETNKPPDLLCFVLFWTPGRTLFMNMSEPSQGFGSDSNRNSGCGVLLTGPPLLLQELFS